MIVLEKLFRRLQRRHTLDTEPDTEARGATYPQRFPNGWYRLCASSELGAGESLYREVVGEKLVVFRSDVDGTPQVIDAYCPHLGANLAGGRIADGCIECPFHRWQVYGDGRVRAIPYERDLQPSLRTRSWPVVEKHDGVFFWYTAGRSERPTPIRAAFPLDDVPEIVSGEMVYRGHWDAGTVDMHLLEFAENSVDFQHFSPLHGRMLVPFVGLPVPLLGVKHVAEWRVDPDKPWIAYFDNDPVLELRGRELPSTAAHATITFYGAGSITSFRFTVPELGDIVLFHNHTPLSLMRQKVDFWWYAERKIPRILVYYVVGSWIAQWREDVEIWERKIHRARPMVTANDGPINKMRRWYQQFYDDPIYEPSDEAPAATAEVV